MSEHRRNDATEQAQAVRARLLAEACYTFVKPLLVELYQVLDRRLVVTCLAPIEALVVHRQRQQGLLLLGMAMMSGGMLAIARKDYRLGRARLEESHAYFQQMGHQHFSNVTRSELAHVAQQLGEDERAVQLYREVILVWKHEGHRAGLARCFECLAFIVGAQGQVERAARLFGAAEFLRQSAHAAMMPEEQVEYAQQVQQMRGKADETMFKAAWADGRALTLEQAIALALHE